MSDSLQPHALQHARPPCPSPTPRVYSNSCPLCWWCHPTISSSVIPFSSQLQVFSSESVFHIRWPKDWSFSFSISPSNEYQDWFPLRWTGWISLQSKGLSRVFSNTSSKPSIPQCLALFIVQLSHPYKATGKTITLTRRTFAGNVPAF